MIIHVYKNEIPYFLCKYEVIKRVLLVTFLFSFQYIFTYIRIRPAAHADTGKNSDCPPSFIISKIKNLPGIGLAYNSQYKSLANIKWFTFNILVWKV